MITPSHLSHSQRCEDVRRLWHSGTAHAPVDSETFKQWVLLKNPDLKPAAIPRLDVNKPIPYIVDKEEQKRQESILTHVPRRNPDTKLHIEEIKPAPLDGEEELKYTTNQRLLSSSNPLRYQIMRQDFKAPSTYQVHLLNSKERVVVKTFVPNVPHHKMQDQGIRTSSYEGIIREKEHDI